MKGTFCISFDVDWVKDEILKPLVDVLIKKNIKATFFATHKSDLLLSLDKTKFEIGIHPNFDKSLDNLEKPIKDLLQFYPDTKGVRSHTLFESGRLLLLFQQYGFKYVSNIHLPYHENLHPVIRFGSPQNKPLVGIPFSFADDFHFTFTRTFDIQSVFLNKTGLNVLAFHPMHIFMNTDSEKTYNGFKNFYHDPQELLPMKNKSVGVETLFNATISYIEENKIDTYTMNEVAEIYLSSLQKKL